MENERLIGTFVDLHGYFHLWFPTDRADVVAEAMIRMKDPQVVFQDDRDGLTSIEVLNIHAARVWSLQELDYWPEIQRGKMLVMLVEQDEDGLPYVQLCPPEDLEAFRSACCYLFRESAREVSE